MLLVDSHALIWFARGDKRVGREAREALADPTRAVFVSVVTYWEIEVKQRRSAEFLLPEPLSSFMARAQFEPLDLHFDVPGRVSGMPNLHGDPFDRLLVAQALHHDLVLVTGDKAIRRYPVETIW